MAYDIGVSVNKNWEAATINIDTTKGVYAHGVCIVPKSGGAAPRVPYDNVSLYYKALDGIERLVRVFGPDALPIVGHTMRLRADSDQSGGDWIVRIGEALDHKNIFAVSASVLPVGGYTPGSIHSSASAGKPGVIPVTDMLFLSRFAKSVRIEVTIPGGNVTAGVTWIAFESSTGLAGSWTERTDMNWVQPSGSNDVAHVVKLNGPPSERYIVYRPFTVANVPGANYTVRMSAYEAPLP
jgi:hypothetical protein